MFTHFNRFDCYFSSSAVDGRWASHLGLPLGLPAWAIIDSVELRKWHDGSRTGLGRCSRASNAFIRQKYDLVLDRYGISISCGVLFWRGSKISIFTPYGLAEARSRLQGCGKKKEGVRSARTRSLALTLAQEHTVRYCTCIHGMHTPCRTGQVSTLAVRHGVIAAQVAQPAGACSWERGWQGCRK